MKTQFTIIFLVLFLPCFVSAQVTKPGYEAAKKNIVAPAGPKKFNGNSTLIVKIDHDGTLYVDFEKIYKFKKGDVWKSSIQSGMHEIELTHGTDKWSKSVETKSGKQLIVSTELRNVANATIGIGVSGSFKDSRDGTSYRTVTFSNGKTWMAENLNYNVSGSKCYDNSSGNCSTYGRLYTWQQAKQACPPGWRLPTKADFEQLKNSFYGSKHAYSQLIKGGKSGFNALLGGYHFGNDSSYPNQGKKGAFWSSTEFSATTAWRLLFGSGNGDIFISGNNKRHGYSCRCLKDE